MAKKKSFPQFTVSDAAALTGLTVRQIRNLAESSVMLPEGKTGKGAFRFFGLMQVVGIAFLLRQGPMPPADKAQALIKFLMDFSEEELLAEFAAGRTHLMVNEKGHLQLFEWKNDKQIGENINLKSAYDLVLQKFPALDEQATAEANNGPRRGRKTGLLDAALKIMEQNTEVEEEIVLAKKSTKKVSKRKGATIKK